MKQYIIVSWQLKKTPRHISKQIKHISILLIGFISFGLVINPGFNNKGIQIQWIDHLKGDFDFRTKWSYPKGVYRNKYGQLSCDGFCPDGIESMKDNDGRIYTDSLTKFYQLVDTTRQFHSIQCEAWCFEWAGTDFIKAKQTKNNQIKCYTLTNVGTHCRLILEIFNDTCIPRIELNSIASTGLKTYYCKSGFININKNFWKQSILKAEFNFDFINTDDPDRKMFWKGKIYTMIERQ